MSNGTLRVLSTLARTGWLKYLHTDGSEHWEYVSPDVLFSDRHLNSLQGLTLTLDHPSDGKITTNNWGKYAIGMSSTQVIPNQKEGTIDVVSIIGSQVGIDAILKDGVRGISEGYFAPTKIRNDSTSDVLRLDQEYREANHYSLCKNPRAGDAAKVHFDSEKITTPYCYQIGWDEKNDSQYYFFNEKSKKVTSREDNTWQILNVTL